MESAAGENKIEMSPDMLRNLNATRKWTMFLSVLGFIFLGFLIVFGIVTSTFLSFFRSEEVNLGLPESVLIILFLAASVIYFLPILFLFRFSRSVRDAVQYNDCTKMKKAFRNLKLYFTYTGILVIIILSLYIAALVAAGASITLLNG